VPDWAGDAEVHWLHPFGEPDEVIPDAEPSAGTDIGALRRGLISVTPLSFAVELDHLSAGYHSFVSRLTGSFPIVGLRSTA
jgi:hypothetical protein